MKLPAEESLSNAVADEIANHRVNTPSQVAAPANPPPSYAQATPQQLPELPRRNTNQPPPKPEIGQGVALYQYKGDPDDCEFEAGDRISIYENANPEWSRGRNMRTGSEGLFPANYIRVEPKPGGFYGGEKQVYQPNPYSGPSQAPPPQANPYNAAVPPMAVAEQSTGDKQSKGGEMGKKFGKKLGNAAIFGAGATIGGNIVNSIF